MAWVPDDVDRVIEAERRAHTYARERGFSGPLYAVIRALASAVLRTWFRVRVSGAAHIPAHGGVIVAPNHKNFLDPFFIGIVNPPARPVHGERLGAVQGSAGMAVPAPGGVPDPPRRGAMPTRSIPPPRS